MSTLIIVLILSMLSMSGCVAGKSAPKDKIQPVTMMDVYASATGQSQKDVAKFIENNLKEQKTFGYVKPYIPVMNEPVVRKVWIPDHKSEENSDVLIAGHWVYVMIQPSNWFVESKTVDSKLPVIIPVSAQTELNEIPEKVKEEYGSKD